MRIASILHLYRVRLRSRLVQELLTLAGIAVGVGLVFAALIANTSLTGSVRQLTEAIVGDARLQIASRGPGGFDVAVLERARRIGGVEAAAGVLDVRANVVGPDARRSVVLIGGDSGFSALDGAILPEYSDSELGRQRSLGLPKPLADQLGLSWAQPVTVEVSPRTTRLPLGIQLQRSEIGDLIESPIALAPLHVVQSITGMDDRVSRVFVAPADGETERVAARLRAIAPEGASVLDARADVAAFERAAYPTNQPTALFSAFSALVGFLFAFSAMLLTVPQRRRLAADLKMAGYPPWGILQLLLFDAFVLGVVGSALGLLLGDQLSRHLFDATPGYLSAAFPVGSQRLVTLGSVGLAIVAGLLAASLAVLVPVVEVLRRAPAAGRAVVPLGWLVAAGAACLATTTVVIIAAPDAALAGLVTLTLAMLLLLPAILRLVTAAFARVTSQVRSPVPVLARTELRPRSAQARTIALAATGAVAVFATVAIGGSHADLRRGLETSAREIDSNGDVWVTFRGQANTFATMAFPDPRASGAELAAIPGVRDVAAYRGGFLDVGAHRAWVLAPPADAERPVPPSQIPDGSEAAATERLREGGWAELSDDIARELDVDVGEAFTLPSPIPTRLRLAAISTNLGWPPGAIVLNAADYARAWDSSAPSALHVDLEPRARPAAVSRRLEEALGGTWPVAAETRGTRVERHVEAARDGLSRLTEISVVVLISAILAMAAAMGGMIWQRRPTIASLKVHGYPESELWKALLLESGLLLGTGCLAGAVFGLYGQVLMSRALETITGFPVFYSTALAGAVAILGLVTAVALAMLALPGWLAVRVRPAPGVPT